MAEDFWNQFGDKSRIKFVTIGDTAIGNITNIKLVSFSGDDSPELTLLCDDGELRTMLASQTVLQRKLAEAKPRIGDRVKVVFTEEQPGKFSNNPTKMFEVSIRRAETLQTNGGGMAPQAQPPMVVPAPQVQAPPMQQAPVYVQPPMAQPTTQEWAQPPAQQPTQLQQAPAQQPPPAVYQQPVSVPAASPGVIEDEIF